MLKFFFNIIKLIFYFYLIEIKAFGQCTDFLSFYPEDCKIHEEFKELKNSLSEIGINIENLVEYRSKRFISEKDFKLTHCNGTKKYIPWEIYSPSPMVWEYWEKGNHFRAMLSKKLNEKKDFELTSEDIKLLHKKVITESLVGPAQKFVYKTPLINQLIPKPGEYRKNDFFSGISGPFEKSQIDFIQKNLKNEHSSFLTYSAAGGPLSMEKVYYLTSHRIEPEMNKLIKDINENVNKYINSKSKEDAPKQSPIEFIAEIQRRFIAIHPFHEGVGRTSRLIQDLISEKLGIPFIPAGELQNDVLTTLSEYQKQTKKSLQESVEKLKKCRNEHISKRFNPLYNLSPECEELYKNKSESKILEKTYKTTINEYLHELPACELKEKLSQQKLMSFIEEILPIVDSKEKIGHCDKTPEVLSYFPEMQKTESLLSPEVRIKIIETLAEKQEKSLLSYTWVSSRLSAMKTDYLVPQSSYFCRILDQGIGLTLQNLIKQDAFSGFGLYVSKSPSDSVLYSFKNQDTEEKNVGEFRIVEIPAGYKLLDATHPEVKSLIDKKLINFDDICTLPADIVIAYGHENWRVIRLRNQDAFKVRSPDPEDLWKIGKNNLEDMFKLKIELEGKQRFFSDLYNESKLKWEKTFINVISKKGKLVAQQIEKELETEYLKKYLKPNSEKIKSLNIKNKHWKINSIQKKRWEAFANKFYKQKKDIINFPFLNELGQCVTYNKAGEAFIIELESTIDSEIIKRQRNKKKFSYSKYIAFMLEECKKNDQRGW